MDAIDAFLRGDQRSSGDAIDSFLMAGRGTPQPSPGQMDQDLASRQVMEGARKPLEVDPMAAAFAPQPTEGEVLGSRAQREDLRSRGITVGNAPVSEQFKAGFGLNDIESYRRMGYEAMTDPQSGRLLIRRSPTEPWQTASEPGLPTVGDVAGVVGPAVREVPAFIGGALGALGGGAAGTPAGPFGAGVGTLAGGVAGAGAGAYTGETGRLKIGQYLGTVPDDANIKEMARREAMFAGGGAGVGGLASSVARRWALRGLPHELRGLTPQQVEEVMAGARASTAGTGVEDLIRPSQAFSMSDDLANKNVGDKLFGLEDRILRSGGESRDALADSMRRQIGALESGTERVAGEAPMLAAEQVGAGAGRAVGQEIRGEVREQIARQGGGAGEARAAATQAQEVLQPAKHPEYAGETLRRRIEEAYDAAEKRASEVFERAKAGLSGVTGPVRNTVSTLEAERENVARILLPSLTEQDKPLIESGLKRLESGTASVDEIQQTLQAIRREIRRVNTGVATADVQQLMRLENALQADRDAMIGPVRARALTEAEQGWRELRDDFQRAPLVGRSMERRRGGAESIEDFDLGRLGTVNPTNARAIANVLRREGDTAGLEEMRQAMRYQAQRAAGLRSGDALDPKALQGWLDRNDPLLSSVFSRDEIKAMFNPARLQREFKNREAAMNDLRKTIGPRFKEFGIDRTISGEMRDPASFVDRIAGSGNQQLAQNVMAVLRRRDPTLANEMQARVRQRLSQEISDDAGRPTAERITSVLGDDARMRVYREILGPQFEDRVRRIAVAVGAINPERIAASVGAPGGGFKEILARLQRAVFSPLSAASRRTTLAREILGDTVAERIGRAIVDEREFVRLIRMLNPNTRGRAVTMGAGAVLGTRGGEAAERKIEEFQNGR